MVIPRVRQNSYKRDSILIKKIFQQILAALLLYNYPRLRPFNLFTINRFETFSVSKSVL